MSIKAMFYLLILLLISAGLNRPLFAAPTSNDANINSRFSAVSERFNLCLGEIGDFYFSKKTLQSLKELKVALPNCDLVGIKSGNEEFQQYIFSELLGSHLRKHINDFSDASLASCHAKWTADWATARESALDVSSNWRIVGKVFAPQPSENSSDAALEVFLRARQEVEMTLIIQKRDIPNQPDKSNCYNMWTNISIARAENLAFVERTRMFERYRELGILPDTFPGLWLIIQHADLFPKFRQKGLAFFEEYALENKIPAEYVNALKRRIEMQRH
ncbi:MAG: hypothetical protein JKY60_18710 [Kordiimonadaceae bacterium]|nr:hypothetical protein [Kordiimonadaceae bacterium]